MNISQVNVQQAVALWAMKQSMQIATRQANPAVLQATAPVASLEPLKGNLIDVRV